MSKYAPLTRHLRAANADRLAMTFAELEGLLGFALPPSARKHRAWWANSPQSHVNAAAWYHAGYQSQAVDLETEKLMFVKLNTLDMSPPRKPGRHPMFGSAKGQLWIAPGYDLTEPADPEWGKRLYEETGPWDKEFE